MGHPTEQMASNADNLLSPPWVTIDLMLRHASPPDDILVAALSPYTSNTGPGYEMNSHTT